jgi:hypothetical protein
MLALPAIVDIISPDQRHASFALIVQIAILVAKLLMLV